MSNNCNTFLRLLVWLIQIIEPPIKQIHNFVAHLNLKPTIVIKPQDKSLTEWTLRLVYCQAQFLVVEEVRAPQSPRVPRAKVPKVPKDKTITKSHSNTSLTLKKVHLVRSFE